jgi:hypothetical protein
MKEGDHEKVESAYLLFECFDSTKRDASYSIRLQIRSGIQTADHLPPLANPPRGSPNALNLFLSPRVDGRRADFPDNLLDHVWANLGHHYVTMRNYLGFDSRSRGQLASGQLVTPHATPENIKEATSNLISVVLFTPGGQYRLRSSLTS